MLVVEEYGEKKKKKRAQAPKVKIDGQKKTGVCPRPNSTPLIGREPRASENRCLRQDPQGESGRRAVSA